MNRRHVGQLVRQPGGGIAFTYDRAWLDWEYRLPISLSLPLQSHRYAGAPVSAVFENLLPDNNSIRTRVAERVGADGIDAYSLLARIGGDCVGALQLLPDDVEPSPLGELSADPLSEDEIETLLNELDIAPLGLRRDTDFRISVAGAQEKTALLWRDGQWWEPHGTTPTTHIIKPEIGRLPNGMDLTNSVENEYLCLKILEAFGLPVAHTEIATFGARKALVVERFDRRWAEDGRLLRLPQEDCCQALSVPPTRKYQSEGGPGVVEIMQLLLRSDSPVADREAFFKANVIFWLIGATDGHAKNFSIGLLPGGRFQMTPFYDVLTVQPTFDAGQIERRNFRLAMRVGTSRNYRIGDVVPRHFIETGTEAGLSRTSAISILEEAAARAGRALDSVASNLPGDFPSELMDTITAAVHDRVRLFKSL